MDSLGLILIAVVLFFLLQPGLKESFVGAGGRNYGSYPEVYGNYGMDDWHKYWHESKAGNGPVVFDKYHADSPPHSCNNCYYPLRMPFN